MRLLCAALVLSLVAVPAGTQEPVHPLDGLSASEHWAVRDVLLASGQADADTRFLYAALHEPPKSEVLAWRPGASFRREAFVHLVKDAKGYEAVVNLRTRRVTSFREVTDRQYMANRGEDDAAGAAMLGHAEVRQALARRGIADLSTIVCFPINHGYFDLAEERGRRLARVSCFDSHQAVSSWGAPIGGLHAVIDLKDASVVRVVDTGARPAASLMGEHHPEAIGPTRPALSPILISQPSGPGYDLDGQEVSWDGWKFHFRVDPRRGVVISLVRHEDAGRDRSVLYQASLSELFVPYMSPDEPWNYQSYYDLGTYPSIFGGIASPLEPGHDCPDYATYFSGAIVSASGVPFERPRLACLFERVGAEPAWRHARNAGEGGIIVESRARRDLVLRMIMGAGNYDYLFDWVFMQDGSIRVQTAATGMDQVMGARARTAAEARSTNGNGSPDDRYGRFIAPYLVAVNHSHFFSFRLDFDVDGPENTLMVDRLQTEGQPADNARRSVWRVNSLEAKTESDAKRHSTMSAPEVWRVVNPSVMGPYGDPVGYHVAGHGAMSLLADDDYLRRRAGFTDYTLWATPASADELFAAGPYPTGGAAGAGLPAWTSANRPIANTDIVVWYTLGFHHLPRPEDYPILALEPHGFEIRPFGFFSRNPAIDIPRGGR